MSLIGRFRFRQAARTVQGMKRVMQLCRYTCCDIAALLK